MNSGKRGRPRIDLDPKEARRLYDARYRERHRERYREKARQRIMSYRQKEREEELQSHLPLMEPPPSYLNRTLAAKYF